ncbi:MAG: ABC transporter ATP-binding protein [Candidatus Thorarchaeota archaeon]
MTDILTVNDLYTVYYTPFGEVKAVDGCSITLKKGETLGIAGESGCGKTTFAMSILRLIQPPHKVTEGSVIYKGEDILKLSEKEFRDYRWKELALVLQQSMYALNPMIKILDQMIEPLLLDDVDKEEATEKAKSLLELVGIDPSRISSYPHEFSGGMKQRVLIALSLISEPDVVVLDEPTTALDVVVQHMILKLIDNLKKDFGLSVIWITHDLAVLSELCDRIAIMYAGRIVETGTSLEVILNSKHPYTIGLLSSFPTIDQLDKELISIEGTPPDLINPPSGCKFHPRCTNADEKCRTEVPIREKIEERERGFIECHHWRDL